MWTIRYHGMWIHGYLDNDECRWGTAEGYHEARNLRAAKRAITRRLNANAQNTG